MGEMEEIGLEIGDSEGEKLEVWSRGAKRK